MSQVCLQFVVVMNSRKIGLKSLLETVEGKNRRHPKSIKVSTYLERKRNQIYSYGVTHSGSFLHFLILGVRILGTEHFSVSLLSLGPVRTVLSR
jgi:hypothetical protein